MSSKRHDKLKEIPDCYREDLFDKVDGRLRLVKDLRSSLQELMNDLGGPDSLSYQQRSLCKRTVFLEHIISQWEEDIASGGEAIDVGKHTQCVNALIGLFRHLGLERRAKEIPDLQSYLTSRGQDL